MSTYEEVIDWLFVQVPNFQRQGGPAYKPGLDNIQKLLKGMENPQELFSCIHIAGTNGKGSVAHMTAAMYQANGYKVGIYTSPHINDFRERIKINGEMVSKQFVVDFIQEHIELIKQLEATFFEITTAMAFLAFSEEKVDIAILETGMGGRLDATNVVRPEIAVITTVEKDHTKYLGDTIAQIAGEKAGIIKANTPLVIGYLKAEAEKVIRNKAVEMNARIYETQDVFLETKLMGRFQKINALTAYQVVQVMKDKWPVKDEKTRYGLINVSDLTAFKGRMQVVQNDPWLVVDAAHNPAGVKNLFMELGYMNYDALHLVFGASSDKDLRAMFNFFDKQADYYFTEFNSPRAASVEYLTELGKEQQLNFTSYHSPQRALQIALSNASESDLIVVFGSFYILEDVLI